MSVQSENKLKSFVDKLLSLGYRVAEANKKPQIYSINNVRVNIRVRAKSKSAAGNRIFWYSVTFSVLQQVSYVIYITTTHDYFFMLPSSFLESLKDRMYPDRKNDDVGVFDIDWDDETIELKQSERISLTDYYYNLIEKEHYPILP